jgi:hypothetical protein
MKRSQGMPAWVDFATDPCMSNWRSAAGPLLGQPPPAGVAHTRRAIAHRSLPDEIDIGKVSISGPVALEIVEEGRPVRLQSMHLEIAQRKRKAVVSTTSSAEHSEAAGCK